MQSAEKNVYLNFDVDVEVGARYGEQHRRHGAVKVIVVGLVLRLVEFDAGARVLLLVAAVDAALPSSFTAATTSSSSSASSSSSSSLALTFILPFSREPYGPNQEGESIALAACTYPRGSCHYYQYTR